MSFAFGRTVTLHSRGITGQDADGNDVYGDTDICVDSVAVWPRTSSEQIQGQDLVITGLVCVLPCSTDPSAVDAVTISGRRYDVDGEPGDYTRSPLTGSTLGWLLNLRRVTG